jgi:hypothetical protein
MMLAQMQQQMGPVAVPAAALAAAAEMIQLV